MTTTFTEIQEAYKIKSLFHQKIYLVDGELKAWEDVTKEVYSTISYTKEKIRLTVL